LKFGWRLRIERLVPTTEQPDLKEDTTRETHSTTDSSETKWEGAGGRARGA
jgi:hypothetical protein